MTSVVEVLFARRPEINYVSPPACEVIISAFSGLLITLSTIGKIPAPSGLIVIGLWPGPFSLDWSTDVGEGPPVICYNIYQVVGEQLLLVAECVNPPPGGGGVTLPPGSPGGGDVYVVTPVTPEGEGPPSLPIITPVQPPEPPGCIEWNLSWEQTFAQAGNPPATAGGSGTANGFSFQLSQGVPQFPFEDCTFVDQGSQNYTLAEDCLMDIHISISFSGDGIASGSIQIDLDNAIFWSPGIDLTIPGEYDFQVLFPAGSHLTEVIVFRGGNSFSADEPVSYSWTMTITPA